MRIRLDADSDELAEELVQQLDYEELTAFICKIDLVVAEVGFTEDLIRKLVLSLDGGPDEEGDLDESEMAEFLASLDISNPH